MRIPLRAMVLGLGIAAQGTASLALAGLGGDLNSVGADRAQLRAQAMPATVADRYSIRTLQLPSGTVVREYLSPAGQVFAVSWRGPIKPNLAQLLGTYFQSYQAAAKAQVHNNQTRRYFLVRQPDLVVESSGRMRLFMGRAYVPSLLPAAVTADDIH